jgi:hypothetical protein
VAHEGNDYYDENLVNINNYVLYITTNIFIF